MARLLSRLAVAVALFLVLGGCSETPRGEAHAPERAETTEVPAEGEEAAHATSADHETAATEPASFDAHGIVGMRGPMIGGSDGSIGPDRFCMHMGGTKKFSAEDQLVVKDAAGTVVAVAQLDPFVVSEETTEDGETTRQCFATFLLPGLPEGDYFSLTLGDVTSQMLTQAQLEAGYIWDY